MIPSVEVKTQRGSVAGMHYSHTRIYQGKSGKIGGGAGSVDGCTALQERAHTLCDRIGSRVFTYTQGNNRLN